MADANDSKLKPTNTIVVQRPDVVFFHYPCPDGLASRVVIEDYFGATASTISFRRWTHGKSNDMSQLDGKVVWWTDVTPTLAILESKEARSAKLHSIRDHHANDSNAALLKRIAAGEFPNATMVLETGTVCAALMMYRYLHSPAEFVSYWLDQINKGDTNLIHSRTLDEKAYHAWITRPSLLPATADTKLFRVALNTGPAVATASGHALLKERQTECDQAVRDMEKVDWKHSAAAGREAVVYRVAYSKVVSAPSLLSTVYELAMASLTQETIDILAMPWTGEDGTKQLSIRRPVKSTLDLSEIARSFGGGGHPAASGIQGIHRLP